MSWSGRSSPGAHCSGSSASSCFGQFHNVVAANADFFTTAAGELAGFVGLPAAGPEQSERTPFALTIGPGIRGVGC